ncbi:MAG: hypothetical protein D3904_02740, partial [Candidatus Electrothrix sp. EH2]|nr:hypothetical protein [Candidatus Electrothrix sp. EH2]
MNRQTKKSSKQLRIRKVSALTGACCFLLSLPGGQSEAATVDSAAMTAAHNQWRAKTGVPYLTWSNKLATSSQQWAEQLARRGCNL